MTAYYRIRENYRLPAALDVQAAGEKIDHLQREGRADAASILEEAQPLDSPLHAGIRSWDLPPEEAKRRVLLSEAKYLRDAIAVVYMVEDQEVEAPAFVHISLTDEILATERAVQVADQRKLLLQQGLKDLRSWDRRYGQLKEFARLHDAIRSLAA